MNNLSVRQRLIILVLLPLLIIAVFAFTSLASLQSGPDKATQSETSSNLLDTLQTQILGISLTLNKIDHQIILPNDALAQLNQAEQNLESIWTQYKTKANDDAGLARQQPLIAEIEPLLTDSLISIKAIKQAIGQPNTHSSGLAPHYYEAYYSTTDPLLHKLAALAKLDSLTTQNTHKQQSSLEQWLLYLCLALFFLTLLLGYFIAKSILHPLEELRHAMEAAEQNHDLNVRIKFEGKNEFAQASQAFGSMLTTFHKAITQVNSASQRLTEEAENLTGITGETHQEIGKQSQETELVATATTQMSHGVEEVSRNAAKAAEAANTAQVEARNGTDVLQQVTTATQDLQQKMASAQSAITRVEEDSVSIDRVLEVIRGIAEQTNLLALNAAIEAARAGDQGRGFAVVADEVRTLAQKTQTSTSEIQEMIERLQSGSQQAVEAMNKGGVAVAQTVSEVEQAELSLSKIAESVYLINDMNSQIASATEEQMAASQEISCNINNISDICYRSESAVQAVEQACMELAEVANQLQDLVKQFRV